MGGAFYAYDHVLVHFALARLVHVQLFCAKKLVDPPNKGLMSRVLVDLLSVLLPLWPHDGGVIHMRAGYC